MRWALHAYSSSRRILLAGVVVVMVAGCRSPGAARSGKASPGASTAPPARPAPPASPDFDATSAIATDPCAGTGDLEKRDDLTCADRKAWYRRIGWSNECEDAYARSLEAMPAIQFHDLGRGRHALEVTCTLGAYQGYALWFTWTDPADGGPPSFRGLEFPTYEVPDDRHMKAARVIELWGDAEFDADRKELRVVRRFRGHGDCGLLARYAFPDSRPRVVEMRVKNRCDGKIVPPEAWPRVAPPAL